MDRTLPRRRILRGLAAGTAAALAGCSTGDGDGTDSTDRADTASPSATGAVTSTAATAGGSATTDPTEGPTTAGSATDAATETGTGGPASTATPEPSLRTGTIDAGELPAFADIVPPIEPTTVTAWTTESDRGISLLDPPDSATDTLRFDAMRGAVNAAVVSSFLLDGESGAFLSRLWTDLLQAEASVEWSTVIGGVAGMYGDVPMDAARESLAGTDDDFEYVDDGSDRLLLRGPEDDVVGITPSLYAFIPVGDGTVPFSPEERVGAILDAALGTGDRLVETDDAFAASLRRAGPGNAFHAVRATDGTLGELFERRIGDADGEFTVTGSAAGFADARSAVCEIGLTPDGDAPLASATIGYADAGDVDEEALLSNVGQRARDRDYVQEGTTVQASGEYAWDALSAYTRDGLSASGR